MISARLINNIQSILLIIALTGLFFSIRSCRENKYEILDNEVYQRSLTDTIRHLKNNVAQKEIVYVNAPSFDQIIKERDDLKKQLALMKIKPKNVTSITSVTNTITLVDTLKIHDTIAGIPIIKDSIRYITEKDSEFLVTSQKTFLFKKNEFDISVRHTNPHIQLTGLENITIREEKKWYQSEWLKAAAGFIGGFLIFHK